MNNLTTLIPCSDFVLLQKQEVMRWGLSEEARCYSRIANYASFLKNPLQLGHFVPCSEDGKVLELPSKPLSPNTDEVWDKYQSDYDAYQKTLNNVLFEGFNPCPQGRKNCVDFNGYHLFTESLTTIEDILKHALRPTLTQAANKIIF